MVYISYEMEVLDMKRLIDNLLDRFDEWRFDRQVAKRLMRSTGRIYSDEEVRVDEVNQYMDVDSNDGWE